MFTKNSAEFIERASTGVMNALNTEVGQELTSKLLEMKLAENPNMTAEEWQKIKQQFMVFCFAEAMKANPELMKELATHTYNELNK